VAKLKIEDAIGERSPSRLLRRINKLLDLRMRERFSEADPSFEEWKALKLIHDGLVENAGDLARDFAIGTGATTRLIDSLEGQGFVERDRTSEDRRVVLLKLTQRGEKHFRNKVPDMINCWDAWLKEFKKDEVEQLIKLLTKLQTALAETRPVVTIPGL
jgi:DNA-binding MarR family transcriptional regulator